jgi:hypothetical protein
MDFIEGCIVKKRDKMYGGDDSLFTTGDATAKNDDKDKYYFKQEAFG